MTKIDVPDWVVAVALEACGEHFTGSDDDMRAAIAAALGDLVVPVGRLNDSSPTLYALRQEKPK